MTEKELRKLSRADRLELLELSGVIENAQSAADMYLENLEAVARRQEDFCAEKEKECVEKCERLMKETKERCDRYEEKTRQRCMAMLREAQKKSR